MNFKEYQDKLRNLLKAMDENELRGYIWHQLSTIQDNLAREQSLDDLKKNYQMPACAADVVAQLSKNAHQLMDQWSELSEEERCIECWIDEDATAQLEYLWDDDEVYEFLDPSDLFMLVNQMMKLVGQACDLYPALAKEILLTLVDHPLTALDDDGILDDADNSYDFLYSQHQIIHSMDALWSALLPRLLQENNIPIKERMAGLPERTKEITGSLFSLQKAISAVRLSKEDRQEAAMILARSVLDDFQGTDPLDIRYPMHIYSSDYEECLSWIFDEVQRDRLFWEGLPYYPDLAVRYFDTYEKKKCSEDQIDFIRHALKVLDRNDEKNKKELACLHDCLVRIYQNVPGAAKHAEMQDELKQSFLLHPTFFRYDLLVQNIPDAELKNLAQHFPEGSFERKLYSLLDGDPDLLFQDARDHAAWNNFCLLLSMLDAGHDKDILSKYQEYVLSSALSGTEIPPETLLEKLFARAKERAHLTETQKSKILDLAGAIALSYCENVTGKQERNQYAGAARIAGLYLDICRANNAYAKAAEFLDDLKPMYHRYPKFRKACQGHGIVF